MNVLALSYQYTLTHYVKKIILQKGFAVVSQIRYEYSIG